MAQPALVLRGYRDFQRVCALSPNKARKAVRERWRPVGDIIKDDAARRISPISTKTAAGYRTRVLQSGIKVQQSIRKTTGRRPDYGGLQMAKALRPATAAHIHDLERATEEAMDDVADYFETGH